MKTVKIYLVLLTAALSSCGVSTSMSVSHSSITTQVHLASGNFKVVDRVSGSAKVPYVLMIGGTRKKQLYNNAYSDMLNKANLNNGSRALANVVREEHSSGLFPIYFKRTISVSANIIEFDRANNYESLTNKNK